MKKSPADYTPSEKKWVAMRDAEKAHKYHLCYGFHNYALTTKGEGVIGLTKINNKRYSALYLEQGDDWQTGISLSWDLQGRALENHADLNMGSVHKQVRVIC